MKFPILVIMTDDSMDLYASLDEFLESSGCEEEDFMADFKEIIDAGGRRFSYNHATREFPSLSPDVLAPGYVFGMLKKYIDAVNAWRHRCGKEVIVIAVNESKCLTDVMLRVHAVLRVHDE